MGLEFSLVQAWFFILFFSFIWLSTRSRVTRFKPSCVPLWMGLKSSLEKNYSEKNQWRINKKKIMTWNCADSWNDKTEEVRRFYKIAQILVNSSFKNGRLVMYIYMNSAFILFPFTLLVFTFQPSASTVFHEILISRAWKNVERKIQLYQYRSMSFYTFWKWS